MDKQQFDRLPKYAKEAFDRLKRERDQAVEKARRMTDTQTPSKIWVEDYGAGIDERREYVQTPNHSVVISHAGVCLRVNAYHDRGIELSWAEGDKPYGTGEVAFIPTSHQQARLSSVDEMYVWPKVKRVEKKEKC